MEGGGGGGAEKENEDANRRRKAKSCKGCLYYSPILNPESRDPTCVGFTRTLDKVPGHVVRDLEIKSSKDGRNLKDLKYYCVGYSLYLDSKDSSADPEGKQVELPLCSGIKLLVGKKVSTPDHSDVHVNSEEDGQVFPKPQQYQPPHSVGEGFLSRFTRNATLVASGVSRNMDRVGRYIKDNVDDMLYPYRRRPK